MLYLGLFGETALGVYSYLTPALVYRRLVASGIDILKDIIKKYLGVSDQPWLKILDNVRTIPAPYDHIGVSYNLTFSYADDLFIDLSSQVAEGYTGRQVKVRLMDTIDQITGKKNVAQPGVAHNLETHNPFIIDYVINELSAGQGEAQPYDVRYVQEGCVITNLRFNENEDKSILIIPETYKGQPVVGIDSLSRDINVGGTENYHSGITKIIIPKTVKSIGEYAFYGMNNLKTVEFESGSTLENIEQGTFMNCKSLTSISLPESIKRIGVGAFKGCLTLSSFTIGANIEQIEAGAFVECNNLKSINVNSGNTNYSSQDGVLFDKNKTELLQYPYGKSGASYTVPASVSEIGAWAFYGNNTLQSINLNQAIMVRKYAFAECSKLTTISADKVQFAEVDVVEGTPWINNKTDERIMLGGALLEYRGTAEEVNLERGIISIAPFAFSENTKLKSITINNGLINIGESAFYKCENLSTVYMNNNNQMVFIGTNVFGQNAMGRKIYVPDNLYNEYKENNFWEQYSEALTVHKTILKFNSNGGSACAEVSVNYIGYVGKLPTPTKEGYKFLGWYATPDFTGEKIEEGMSWESLENEVTLYAKYKEKDETVYAINYHPNNGILENNPVHTYTSEDAVILPQITRAHYTFEGWYYDSDFTQSAGTGWEAGETGDKELYAKWKGVMVAVTIRNEENLLLGVVTLEYGAKGYLPAYTGEAAKGYEFSGWALQSSTISTKITEANGLLIDPWDKYEATTLKVKPTFIPIVYNITIILPNGVSNPGIPTSYTIETPTINLLNVSLNGYRFKEWQSGGQKISSIPTGSTGDKTITAVFDQLYTLKFNANGGRYCSNLTGIKGESVKLPISSRVGCTGKWGSYAFDATYIIQENITFEAVWTPNKYYINYQIFDKIIKVGTYTYYDDDLIKQQPVLYDHDLWMATPSDTTWYRFDGWYKNSTFTLSISKIASGTLGRVTVYGRWKYVRSGTFTITDDGVFSQSSDWISFEKITGYTLSQLKAMGYHSITFTGELTAWQKDDGYKYMQIYDGTGSSAARIAEWWVDHRDGKTKRVYQLNNDGTWTINLDPLTSEILCFRYTASGSFSDTWYNSDFWLSVKTLNQ